MFFSFEVMTEQLHGKILSIYWIILPPVVVILILLEIFKGENPTPERIPRRVFISVLLILSFEYVQKSIFYLTDQIALKIQGFSKLNELTALIKVPIQNMDMGWFAIRKDLDLYIGLFFLSVCLYRCLYLSSGYSILLGRTCYLLPSHDHGLHI